MTMVQKNVCRQSRSGLQDMGSRWKCAKSEAGREPGETYLLQEILNSQGMYCQEGGIRHRRNKNPGALLRQDFICVI